jgi:hypothetical protein
MSSKPFASCCAASILRLQHADQVFDGFALRFNRLGLRAIKIAPA